MTSSTTSDSLPFQLTDIDRSVLAQTDDEFQPQSWEELKQIIAEHNLSILKRWPSDLKRYIQWSSETKAQYGSVSNYIMKVRLRWEPLPNSVPKSDTKFEVRSPVPFQDAHDYKIMPNDWPYAFATGIRHLIVWLKHRLESEPTKGDMTPTSRSQVEEFIQHKFINRIQHVPGPAEKIIWFKNWTALQSVPGMEHVHVLIRNVPEDIIDEWTGGEHMKQ